MDTIMTLLILLWLIRRRNQNLEKRQIRSYKTRPVFRKRHIYGEMNLMREVYIHDLQLFYKSFRMNSHQFDYLLLHIGPQTSTKLQTKDSIDARQRLAMTLRYVI